MLGVWNVLKENRPWWMSALQDGEGPVRPVRMSGFFLDTYEVRDLDATDLSAGSGASV